LQVAAEAFSVWQARPHMPQFAGLLRRVSQPLVLAEEGAVQSPQPGLQVYAQRVPLQVAAVA
jgi:hypothetical protein